MQCALNNKYNTFLQGRVPCMCIRPCACGPVVVGERPCKNGYTYINWIYVYVSTGLYLGGADRFMGQQGRRNPSLAAFTLCTRCVLNHWVKRPGTCA